MARVKNFIELTNSDIERVQSIELGIFREVLQILKRHNINYFAVAGTALGAIKYNGFIPWDDDVDIAIPREQYYLFLEIAKRELPRHLIVQSVESEKDFCFDACKIRDIRTIFTEFTNQFLHIKSGVFIDVFPYDLCDSFDMLDSIAYKARLSILTRKCIGLPIFKHSLKSKIIKFFSRLLVFSDNRKLIYKNVKLITSRHSPEPKWLIMRNCVYDASWFRDSVDVMFADLSIKLPYGYQGYLSFCYGDYTNDPPDDQKVSHHFVVDCCLETELNSK